MGVRLVKYSRTNSSSSNSGGQIYNDHDELTNRDLKNQHPIYAITGLQEVLNVLEDSITETNKLIIATNERIDAILLDIEKIQKEIQDIHDIINNLNVIKDTDDTFTACLQEVIDCALHACNRFTVHEDTAGLIKLILLKCLLVAAQSVIIYHVVAGAAD